MPTRANFDAAFGPTHPLRKLAADIAKMSCPNAQRQLFLKPVNPSHQPANFLSNGCTNHYTPWTPGRGLTYPGLSGSLASWKFGPTIPAPVPSCELHGYWGVMPQSDRGLALLFDPVVDSFIHVHLGASRLGRPRHPLHCKTLIVLTDYGPLLDPQVNLLPGSPDWGEDETKKIISGTNLGVTLINLRDAMRKSLNCSAHSTLTQCGLQAGVLVWNFLAMFRGGCTSSGSSGLPPVTSTSWIKTCLDWIERFINYVKPKRIVWLTWKDLRVPVFGSHLAVLPPHSGTFHRLPLYVMNHPRSWSNRAADHSRFLASIL